MSKKIKLKNKNDKNTKSVLSVVKVGDLPKHTNLQDIKVKLPEHIYKASSLPIYGIKNKPVYLIGWSMGDFFIKTNLKSNQIYPMFWMSVPSDIEEWEVVNYKTKKNNT